VELVGTIATSLKRNVIVFGADEGLSVAGEFFLVGDPGDDFVVFSLRRFAPDEAAV
jgi:hypothetical protein